MTADTDRPSSRRQAPWMLALACLMALSAWRPGIDRLDRWLAQRFWNVPSEWNAIADAAIRTGVVDGTIAGRPAPWRHASVAPLGASKVAVIAVSDMRRTRITIIDPQYVERGRFERETVAPATVTDEARGYKPISDVWPFDVRGDRLETLVASAALVSEAPNSGSFAYLAIGPADTEILFAIDLRWGPGPTWGVLDRTDLNGDGVDDLVVYDCGHRERPPLATFIWNERRRTYVADLAAGASSLIAFWSTGAGRRAVIPHDQPIDPVMRTLLKTASAP
jgi:hypothetical protein